MISSSVIPVLSLISFNVMSSYLSSNSNRHSIKTLVQYFIYVASPSIENGYSGPPGLFSILESAYDILIISVSYPDL